MTTADSLRCQAVAARFAEAVDDTLPPELGSHAEQCDRCRDALHDVRRVIDLVRDAHDGYVVPHDLESRGLAAIDARGASGAAPSTEVGDAPMPPPPPPPPPSIPPEPATAEAASPIVAPRARRFRRSHLAGVLTLAAAGVATAFSIGHSRKAAESAAGAPASAWRGNVVTIDGDDDGLVVLDEKGAARSLRERDAFGPGSTLRTDLRSRARVRFDDGTTLTLDRASEVVLRADRVRSAELRAGSAALDVAANDGDGASIDAPGGHLEIDAGESGKLALHVQRVAARGGRDGAGLRPGVSSLAVARGHVAIRNEGSEALKLRAGEGATLALGTAQSTRAGLAQAFGFSELPVGERARRTVDEGSAGSAPGIGELRAKVIGATGDGDKVLRLARQSVSVKIAGEIARTEIDETFASDDPQTLEGTFRFPLPHDAQIERLALEVDGKLEEGAFVDRDKGAAIWRGVSWNAAPRELPRPREEWIWVPGPWRDPALLEWRDGGAMQLRIFPIPPRGSRRVVLAYTQRIEAAAGVRNYVYPLPRVSPASLPRGIEQFSFEAQVVGHDPATPVTLAGYAPDAEASDAEANGGPALRRFQRSSFVPDGDVVLRFARADEGAPARSYAYRPSDGGAAFVALELTPKLPRTATEQRRTHVLVVDAGRAMLGERFRRAKEIATKVVAEMDGRDRFALLVCDVRCVPMSVAARAPSERAAEEVRRFLEGVSPEGATDLAGAISSGAKLARSLSTAEASERRVLYIGDGVASIGAQSPSTLAAAASAERVGLGSDGAISAVAIGIDADHAALESIARGGGGVVVPYVPGQSTLAASLDALEASYGAALTDVSLLLPTGLDAVTPSNLAPLAAGRSLEIYARTSLDAVEGDAIVRGKLAGQPFETRIPIRVRASDGAGNAFVPRLWAAAQIDELQARGGDASRARVIELSKSYALPSRFTSLLVLESPAMARAFGVEPTAHAPLWTGDEVATAETTTRARGVSGLDALGGMTTTGHDEGDYDRRASIAGGGFGRLGAGTAAPSAAAEAKPSNATPGKKESARPTDDLGDATATPSTKMPAVPSLRPSGQWMRREWYRTVRFGDATESADFTRRLAEARVAVSSSPDSRDKLADLFSLSLRAGDDDEVTALMRAWSSRDPLDPRAAFGRADLAAERGDRNEALRLATGALAAHPDDVTLADELASVASLAGDERLSCALRATHAERRPTDANATAARARCLRDAGSLEIADATLALMPTPQRASVESLLSNATGGASTTTAPTRTMPWGDLVLDATWSGGADLDLVVFDPKGTRISWLDGHGARSGDPTSTTHEALALPWLSGGNYAVELVVGDRHGSVAPATGTLTMRILGETHTVAFTVAGNRVRVGAVQVDWASRLVPGNPGELP
jgi:hypothetical protein